MMNLNINRQMNMVPIAVLEAHKKAFETKINLLTEEKTKIIAEKHRASEEIARLVKENESLRSIEENTRIDTQVEVQRLTGEKEIIAKHNIHLSKLIEQHIADANRVAKNAKEAEANRIVKENARLAKEVENIRANKEIINRITKENTTLADDLKQIKEENTKLIAELNHITKENTRLVSEANRLDEENSRLTKKVATEENARGLEALRASEEKSKLVAELKSKSEEITRLRAIETNRLAEAEKSK